MKKIMLIAICCLAVQIGQAQDTTYRRTYLDSYLDGMPAKDTGSLTMKYVYEDAKAGIKGLAKALKQPAEHVYTVLVRQQVVKAVTGTVLFILALLLSYFVIFRWTKPIYESSKTVEDACGYWIAIVLMILCCFGCVGACLGNLNNIVTGFVNPEYGAIKDIFEFINPPAKAVSH